MPRNRSHNKEFLKITEGKEKEHSSRTNKYSQLEEALNRSEEQLRQSQKLEAVGLLAGGIAHDFNNLLTAISGYSDLTLKRMGPDDPLRHNIKEIRDAGDRAAALTSQLLAFSRKQVLKPRVHNLNDVITDIEKMLRRLIRENIEFRTILDPELENIKVDPGQMEQVIMNLVLNARDAMPNGGSLSIETRNVYLDEEYVGDHMAIPPGAFVRMTVTDTGEGINEAIRPRIFEPFFTTKPVGEGTGLGLSTVHGIIKQSGGDIMVYSKVDGGTTFEIYLPRIDEDLHRSDSVTLDTESYSGTETVLVVEDEEIVRNLVYEILTSSGYSVLEAASGKAALSICETYSETIHIMLTDVVMPRMSGVELATYVAKLRPQIKILFMSGYTDESIVPFGILDSGGEFIEKPFTPNGLISKIKEALKKKSKPSLESRESRKLILEPRKGKKEFESLKKSTLLRSVRVLVVDDESSMSALLRDVLEGLGCEVELASSSIYALDIVREFNAEIIISNYNLSGIDGLQTLRDLHEILPSAILILITDHPDTSKVRKHFREFEFDVLRKPISIFELQRGLEQAVQRRDAIKREKRHGDFLSIVSHELREPLQAPLSILDNLLAGTYGPVDGKQRDRLLRVSQGIRTEKRLVNNLLDLSYIESGRFEIRKVDTSFRNVLKEVIESLEMKASGQQIGIVWDLPKNLYYTSIDVDQIKQALSNVLVNAINHTSAGKVVTVKIRRRVDKIICSIQNEGDGIPAQFLENVFDKLFQVPSSRSNKGLGIGLFITKEIIQAHGGEITAQSKLGKGATFTITLPV